MLRLLVTALSGVALVACSRATDPDTGLPDGARRLGECTAPFDASFGRDPRIAVNPYRICAAASEGATCNSWVGSFGQSLFTSCVLIEGPGSASGICTTSCDRSECPGVRYPVGDAGSEGGIEYRNAIADCVQLAIGCDRMCVVDCSTDPRCPDGERCIQVETPDAGMRMLCMPE